MGGLKNPHQRQNTAAAARGEITKAEVLQSRLTSSADEPGSVLNKKKIPLRSKVQSA